MTIYTVLVNITAFVNIGRPTNTITITTFISRSLILRLVFTIKMIVIYTVPCICISCCMLIIHFLRVY